MDNDFDLYGVIRKIIAEETQWLRHYSGKVLNTTDPINKGRVLVGIVELGFENELEGIWAWSRAANIQIPKVGDYVEIYFMNGKVDQPYYCGILSKTRDLSSTNFTSKFKQIIFEDRNNKNNNIVFDTNKKEYTIGNEGNKIVVSPTGMKINDNLEILK